MLLAVEVTGTDIATAVAGVGGGSGVIAIAQKLWSAWLAREDRQAAERAAEIKRIQDTHDLDLKRLDGEREAERRRFMEELGRLREDVRDRDGKIEDLSKKLSSKSDAHASDVRALMEMTIAKVEGWRDEDKKAAQRAYDVVASNSHALTDTKQELEVTRTSVLVLQGLIEKYLDRRSPPPTAPPTA